MIAISGSVILWSLLQEHFKSNMTYLPLLRRENLLQDPFSFDRSIDLFSRGSRTGFRIRDEPTLSLSAVWRLFLLLSMKLSYGLCAGLNGS